MRRCSGRNRTIQFLREFTTLFCVSYAANACCQKINSLWFHSNFDVIELIEFLFGKTESKNIHEKTWLVSNKFRVYENTHDGPNLTHRNPKPSTTYNSCRKFSVIYVFINFQLMPITTTTPSPLASAAAAATATSIAFT